jgi:2-oxoacid:acceptor oxidoreductase delta subunit (pyruvate/2-ketoisovalerate family)
MPVRSKDLPRAPMVKGTSGPVKTGSWRTLKPVFDLDKCSGCLTCWKFCPDVAIEIAGDKPRVNYDFCKGCGICSNECPKKCIRMIRQELE